MKGVDDAKRKVWKVKVDDLFDGRNLRNYVDVMNVYTELIRDRRYFQQLTDDEMDDLILVAIRQQNTLLFDTSVLNGINNERNYSLNLPRIIERFQDEFDRCDRFESLSSKLICHLVDFFQLSRKDTCRILSLPFIERIITILPGRNKYANARLMNIPWLNRLQECGGDVANRFLATMTKSPMEPSFVSHLAQLIPCREVSIELMDVLWNSLINVSGHGMDQTIEIRSYLGAERNIAKMIKRLSTATGITLNLRLYPEIIFRLFVAGVTREQLDLPFIDWNSAICVVDANRKNRTLDEAERAYRSVSCHLTDRAGKDLTWLIFQYLV